MIYKYMDQINQGEHLGKSIYSSNGQVLLQRGVQLTLGIISKLRQMGITALYIEDKRFDDVEHEEVVSDTTKREAVKTLSESFQYIQSAKKDVNINKIGSVTSKIIDDILYNSKVLLNLSDIRTNDNGLFIHSVNVCIMSVMVGLKLGLARDKLMELAMGALLHDVGKVIKDGQLDKPKAEGYTNDHTWNGFLYLRKRYDISLLSSTVCLQHHEYMDGFGYPRKLKGKDIHQYSKIVAVTNYYDNILSNKDKNEKVHPYEAGERILGLTNTRFDHDVVWNFLRCIAFYPTGSQVRLTNRLTGVVVGQNFGLPQRPIIRIFEMNKQDFNDLSTQKSDIKEINLAEEPTLFIEEIIM